MLILNEVFEMIINDRGINCIPSINKHSIIQKRIQRSKTPEQKLAFSKKMSEARKKVWNSWGLRKRTQFAKKLSVYQKQRQANMSEDEKIKISKKLSDVMKKYWETDTEEKRNFHGSNCTRGLKKSWESRIVYEREESPRINDYAGVLSMSDLEQL